MLESGYLFVKFKFSGLLLFLFERLRLLLSFKLLFFYELLMLLLCRHSREFLQVRLLFLLFELVAQELRVLHSALADSLLVWLAAFVVV